MGLTNIFLDWIFKADKTEVVNAIKDTDKLHDDSQKKRVKSDKTAQVKRRDNLARQIKDVRKHFDNRKFILDKALKDSLISERKHSKAVARAKNETLRKINQIKTGIESATQKTSLFGRSLGLLAKVTGFAFIVAGAARVVTSIIKMNAEANRAKVVFGDSLGKITADAEKMGKAIGLSRREFIGAAAAVGDLLIPLGFARDKAAQLSTETLELAAAQKQFTGDSRSVVEIAKVLTKSFLGEREGLKELGIAISEADVQQQLLVDGTKNYTGAALKQAKVLATQSLLYANTTDSLNSFREGQDGLLGSTNELRANLSELGDILLKLGAVVLLPLIKIINFVVSGFRYLIETISEMETVSKVILLITIAVTGLAIAIKTKLIPSFKLLKKSIVSTFLAGSKAVGKFTKSFGILTLGITLVVAIIGLLINAINNIPTFEKGVEEGKKLLTAYNDIGSSLDELNEKQKDQVDFQRKLNTEKEKIVELAGKELGITNLHNLSLEGTKNLIKKIKAEKIKLIKIDIQRIGALVFEKRAQEGTLLDFIKIIGMGASAGAKIQADFMTLQIKKMLGTLSVLESAHEKTNKNIAKSTSKYTKNVKSSYKKLTDFLKTDIEKEIKSIQKRYEDFLRGVESKLKKTENKIARLERKAARIRKVALTGRPGKVFREREGILAEIKDAKKTLSEIDGLRVRADAKNFDNLNAALTRRTKLIKDYIGQELELKRDAIDRESEKIADALWEERTLKLKFLEDEARDDVIGLINVLQRKKKINDAWRAGQEKIDAKTREKNLKADIVAANKTAKMLSDVLRGAFDLLNVDNISDALGAMTNIVSAINPEVGAILSTFLAIGNTIYEIITGSEDLEEQEKRIKEQEIEREEIQRAIQESVKAELALKLKLLDIERDRILLLDKAQDMQIRLAELVANQQIAEIKRANQGILSVEKKAELDADIAVIEETRDKKIQAVLEKQKKTITTRLKVPVGITGKELADEMAKRAGELVSNQAAAVILESLSTADISSMGAAAGITYLEGVKLKLQSLTGLSPVVQASVDDVTKRIKEAIDLTKSAETFAGAPGVEAILPIQQARAAVVSTGDVAKERSVIDVQKTALEEQEEDFGQMITLLETLADFGVKELQVAEESLEIDKDIRDNTSIRTQEGRGLELLDIGRGLNLAGQFLQTIRPEEMGVSQGITALGAAQIPIDVQQLNSLHGIEANTARIVELMDAVNQMGDIQPILNELEQFVRNTIDNATIRSIK